MGPSGGGQWGPSGLPEGIKGLNIRRIGFALLGFALSMAAWIAGSITAPVALDSLEITIVVDQLRSARGRVRVALWAGPEGFTDADAAIAKADQPAQAGVVRFSIPGLAPGRYAVASYHDENGNGEFDQTWIGLPDEGLGFSNGAWIGLGPPSFEEAEVEITATQSIITVSLRYPSSAPARSRATDR